MDRNQWFIVESGSQVTVTDPDKKKNLYYDGTVVSAKEKTFSWKVWKAAPGSDLFL